MITKTLILSKFQNKPIRVISSLVIALAMVFSSMAFVDYRVNAETSTYVEMDGEYWQYGSNDTSDLFCIAASGSRLVVFQTPQNIQFYVVSINNITQSNPFIKRIRFSDNTVSTYNFDRRNQTYTYNGVTYNVSYWYTTSGTTLYPTVKNFNPISVSTADNRLAVQYTFGELAIDPVEPTTYSTLKDLTFSSSVVGSGNGTGEANRDTITWYPYADSNNKSFGSGGSVEIRVVPGDYISQSQEGIFTQTYSDFVLDVAHAGHLATVPAYNGTYSVNWGTVMQKLSASWPALELLWDGEYWKKLGWVYQVRYQFEEDEDTDNWSEWQTVYNITSSTPTGTQGLDPVDGTAMPGFYENVVDAFNTTSVVNNNSNVTYYVNNIQYTVNETTETPGSDVTNDLLREIRNITIQIRQLIVDQNNDGDERQPDDTGLKDKDDELHDREQELINDMDDKLEDIDTDVELISNNGFLSAANWVRLQYDHLTLNTPFELVIVFSLVLGIALIFIGKVR